MSISILGRRDTYSTYLLDVEIRRDTYTSILGRRDTYSTYLLDVEIRRDTYTSILGRRDTYSTYLLDVEIRIRLSLDAPSLRPSARRQKNAFDQEPGTRI